MNAYKRNQWSGQPRTSSQTVAPAARPALEKIETELKLSAKEARSVAVGGTFNGWQPALTPLSKGADGAWRTRLSLAPGRYEYRFVVDGEWIEDPLAKEAIPNPYGGKNSILSVGAAAKH